MRPEQAGVPKVSLECVQHHQMAGRGGLVLPSQAKTGSEILSHRNHLTPKAFRTKLLNSMWTNGVNRRSGCNG
eukprot:scaffold21416_cov15-Tisochrysis_lutea.AAC.1